MELRVCPQCGREYVPKRRESKYCSRQCYVDRNRSRRNVITIDGDTATIHMNGERSAYIDANDLPIVEDTMWTATRNKNQWYAFSNSGERAISMHRLIMNAEKGQEVDHIDRNGLNNRRSNLRIATKSQNGRNRDMPKGVSGYRGVTWNRQRRKWQAGMKVEGRYRYIGSYADVREAAKAYDDFARSIDGDHAVTNF